MLPYWFSYGLPCSYVYNVTEVPRRLVQCYLKSLVALHTLLAILT
jgi:hypothetical protein